MRRRTRTAARGTKAPWVVGGQEAKRPWLVAALVLAAGLIVAANSASASTEEEPSPSNGLTPSLIREAVDTPDSATFEAPPTDPQAAQQLPHDELGRSEALDLLTSVFGAQVEAPGGIFDDLPPAKFLSNYSGVVQAGALAEATPGAEMPSPSEATEPALLESSVPLRSEDDEGNLAPVDLSLERSEGEMQSANPIVEAGIPLELSEGISLGSGSVELGFPEASGERAPSTVEGDSAFYPNVQEDTDLLVAPTVGGVETMTQLRTPQAPLEQVVRLALPEGAVLAQSDKGGAEATLNGQKLLDVSPPSAIDAAGNDVSVSLSVAGNDVEINVSPGPQTSYPILVDPNYIYAAYNWTWEHSPLLYSQAWYPGTTTPTASYKALPYAYPSMAYPALDVTSGFPGGATSTQGAGWEYRVPRSASDATNYGVWPESYIESVVLEGGMFLLEGNHATYPELIAGIVDPIHGGWVTYGTWTGAQGEITGWAGKWSFPQYGNTDAKTFGFSLATLENEAQAKYRNVLSAIASIQLRDNNTPKFLSVSGPSGWWNTGEPTITYAANDPGLGVYMLSLTPPGGSATNYGVGCVGDGESPCPREYKSSQSGSAAVKVNAATAPEGNNAYKAAVFDPLYLHGSGGNDAIPHMSEQTVRVRVDHSAPSLSLSGTLTEQASLGTAKPQYILKYNAADGTREAATVQTTFGAEGSGNGQFKHPADLALDPSENVWVADQTNNRIEKLTAKGEFLGAYGSLGSGNGQLSSPSGIEADEKGNLWIADTGNNRIQKFGPKGEYLAKFGTVGAGNGQLSSPKGIAVASNGNLWVADTGNNRIEQFSSSGTFVGAFGSKGAGSLQFNEPSAIDVAPNGHVWVADTGNNRIQELNGNGEFLAAYGSLGSGNGQFNRPAGIDVDAQGNVYVLDANNGRIEQLSERGEYLAQFGAKGTASGQFTFSGASGLAANIAGEIWVTDSGDNRVEEWNPPKGTRSGVRKVVVKMDGSVIQEPTVTCPQGGCPLVGEWALHSGEYTAGAHTVEVIATDGVALSSTEKRNITLNPPPPSLSLSGALTEQASLGTALPHYKLILSASAEEGSGVSEAGRSTIAAQITIDGKQVDSGQATCSTETCPITREWTLNSGEFAAGAHTVLAKATDRYGRSTTNQLSITLQPPVPSVTLSGTMTEQATLGTKRPRYILRVNASAEEGTGVAGATTYTSSFGAAGAGSGQFSHPAGIAVDSAGNLWVADSGNNRIEGFNEKGEFLKAVGTSGTGAGQFNHPKSIAVDPKGNFWVADSGNSRIEVFNSKWEFLKAVGSAGSGNGQFSGPEGIAIDAKGNVWVADTYNLRVQELNEAGQFVKVLTGLGAIEPTGLAVGPGGNVWIADWAHNRIVEVNEAGTLLRSFGSPGVGNGQFSHPDVVAIDSSGNVWVGDQSNSRVQVFNQNGDYVAQFGASGSGAGQFSFSYPMGIAADAKGNLWVSDTNNNRVQRWRPPAHSQVTTEIKFDGKQVDSGEATCSTETCPITREWVLGASSELVGSHTIVAKATDGYGQWTSKTRTIEIQPDVTKPTLQLGGELAKAPEGWVQQENYGFNATATDPAGYGVNSLVFRIDGSAVASTTQPCPEGACEGSISKAIDMGPYSGGAHEAEVVATDGAGNTTSKHWTINVDPEGHISTAEATATMEAVEETSDSNLVGEAKEEEVPGTTAGLGLESTETGFAATGSAAPMTVAAEPGGPMIVEVPEAAELFGCEEEGEPLEEECIPQSEEGLGELQPIEITPQDVSEGSAQSHLVGGDASVSANTGSSTDSVVRPLNDGGMIFQAIRDPSAPEDYSFKVELGEEQVLRSVDETRAAVYYSGHLLAFSITAEPAHDAIGTAVPTTLTVEGRDTVTLHVHHRAGQGGQPFVYPVVGGTGWEGGFRTIVVDLGPPVSDHQAAELATQTSLWVGAPEPISDSEGHGGASASSFKPFRRLFVRSACGHNFDWYEGPEGAKHYFENACGNAFYPGDKNRSIVWRGTMKGAFKYIPGVAAWHNNARACTQDTPDISTIAEYRIEEAWQCRYGPDTDDGNGGFEVSAGSYLRAQARWEMAHRGTCYGLQHACPPDVNNPWVWEDKALELHLYASGDVKITVGSGNPGAEDS